MKITERSAEKTYQSAKSLIEDISERFKEIDTSDMRACLTVAHKELQNEDYKLAQKYSLEAKKLAEDVLEECVQELYFDVQDKMSVAAAAVSECKRLGADCVEASDWFIAAKRAVDKGSYAEANDIIIGVKKMTTSALVKYDASKKIPALLDKIVKLEEIGIDASKLKYIKKLYGIAIDSYKKGAYVNALDFVRGAEKIIYDKGLEKVLESADK